MPYFTRVSLEDTMRFDGPTCSTDLNLWLEQQARETNGRFHLRERHYNGFAGYAEVSFTVDEPTQH